MAATAFIGGLAEAVFLVAATRAAFAITDGKDEVGIIADQFFSVNETLLLAFGIVVVRVAFASSAIWQNARVSASVVARVRQQLMNAFLGSAWEVQQRQEGGSLQQLVGEYSTHASSMTKNSGSLVVAAANLTAMLGLAVAIDPPGAIVTLFAVVFLGMLLRPIRSMVRRFAHESNRANMDLAVGVNEVSQLGVELHVFDVQDAASSRLQDRIDNAQSRTRRLQFASSSLSTVYSALAYLALLAALTVVAMSSSTNLTSLGAVMLVMLRSLSYGQALQATYLGIVGSAPAIDELVERLEELESARRHDGGEPVGTIRVIEAANVKFAYPGEPSVLDDVSFRFGPGEIIGIVGPSGGGKSTLVQLLLGLRDSCSGSIMVDGRNISRFARAEWARKVTFVPQSPHLVQGSVADNIRFMRADVSQLDIERAARLAHLHDEIVSSPSGYDRPVGEQGGHLSGGQQQRVCIARALVETPDVLILDEPTSSLDVRSEHLVRETLVGLKGQMTVIVIAHRMSTLEICDRIMVLQGGQVRGLDSPANLEQSSEFYREALSLSRMR